MPLLRSRPNQSTETGRPPVTGKPARRQRFEDAFSGVSGLGPFLRPSPLVDVVAHRVTGLEKVVAEIGRVTGQLRFVHLRAHLDMRDVLSGDQIESYTALRGYAPSTHLPEGGECPHGGQ